MTQVLVTGSRGELGRSILKALARYNVPHYAYSHDLKLSSIPHQQFSHVVNCAAVIPGSSNLRQKYIAGNIEFLEDLLPYCEGTEFFHFSTFSELYRDDLYQKTKSLGNSLMLANQHLFTSLHIIPLPTVDDRPLVESIVRRANTLGTKKPVVDRLLYNFMAYADIADHIALCIQNSSKPVLTSKFECRNLYEEVLREVPQESIVQGKIVDRRLKTGNVFHVCPELTHALVNFKENT